MNFNLKQCIVAVGVLILGTAANAQMCPGDHAKLSHHSEFNITVSCAPGDPDTFLAFKFGNNSGIYADKYAGGWCIDVDRAIYCDQDFMVDSYSSYDNPRIPRGAIDKPENLDMANWLINTYPVESHVDIPDCYSGLLGYEEYQEAMWTILDNKDALDLGAEDCIVSWLVNETETYGNNFEVNCDSTEKVGVVLVIDDDTGYITHQVVLAEIPIAEVEGICDCGVEAYVMGDPHFKTWSGETYDFHGICDLMLLHNPEFHDGLGMDIIVRSKQMKQFSFISTAVIRIGSETFEVLPRKVEIPTGSMGKKDLGMAFWSTGQPLPDILLLTIVKIRRTVNTRFIFPRTKRLSSKLGRTLFG
jgi:hypothetical protein